VAERIRIEVGIETPGVLAGDLSGIGPQQLCPPGLKREPLREMSTWNEGKRKRKIPLELLVLDVHDGMRHGSGRRQDGACLVLFLMQVRWKLGCVRLLALMITSMIPPPVW
jgi:hypothetical protein